MPDHDAGSAALRIVPNAKEFKRLLQADMEKIKAEYKLPVIADITRARADIDKFRAEQEARPVRIRAEIDKSGIDQFKKGLGDAASALGSALKVNLGAAAIGELPALATALTTVAGSMQQLAGAGAVLPGIFAGIGADVGVTKLAIMGVGDAFKALDKAQQDSGKSAKQQAKDLAATNAALANLAPQTADFVRQTYALKSSFDDLQKGVSGKFFDGLGTSVRTLATTDLPVLQRGLGGVATALNQNLKQLGTSLSSGSTQGILDRILGNTGDAQARLSKAIDPIIHAVGTLAAAGTDTLPRLADGVGKIADRFDRFITVVDGDGRLNKWITDGITGFDHFGNTLLNIGKSFTALTEAAGGGGGLLQILDTGSQKLADFLNSTKGQDDLKKFFQEGRDEINQLVPILENLGPIANDAFQAAKDATGIWLPVIKEATDVLAQDPDLVRAIADAFLAWKFVGVITGVSDAVKGIATALGLIGPAAAAAGTEGAAGLAPFAAALGPIAAAIAVITGGSALASDALKDWSNANPDVQRRDEHGRIIRGRESQGGVTDPHTWEPPAGGGGPGAQRDRRGAPPVPGPVSSIILPPPGSGGSFDPIPLPITPGHAGGGVLPGYSPGKDNMLVPLAGGEGIVRPEAVRKYGPGVIHMLNQGFAPGGIVPDYASIATGAAPGGAAPGPAGGGPADGVSSFFSSLFGGLGGAFGLGNTQGGDGGAGIQVGKGLFGLAQAQGSGNPDAVGQWGAQTGDWLGKFGANTLLSFGTTLWQGALGLVGLQDSILSPSNPWFQDAAKSAGFFLGNNGPFATGGQGATKTKGPTGKQLREAGQKVQRADQRVAEIQQRIAELKPDAKESQKLTLQNELANAQQDAGDYRTDLAALGGGGTPSSGLDAFAASQAGKPYISGGTSAAGTDCSGWASEVVKQFLGEPPFSGDRMTTQNAASWITAHGGQLGVGPPGSLQIGWYNHGSNPDDGHMAVTLPDGTNTESGGSGNRIAYGGGAAGAGSGQFDQHAYFLPSGYAMGGPVAGSGRGDVIPAMLTPGEHVFTTSDVAAMGGQDNVYAFRNALHMAEGGDIADALLQPKPPPLPSGPIAKQITRGGTSVIPTAPTKQLPAPVPAPPPPASSIPPPPDPVQAPPPVPWQVGGPAPAGGAPDPGATHLLPAISKAITSGATVLGNIAQTAAAVGTFGAAGMAGGLGAGGGGGGGGGPSISGAIQQLGKVAVNIANVGASLLVGSVPGSFGDPNMPAQGQQLRPAQNVPHTAQDARALGGGRTTNIYGVDTRNIVDTMRLQDSQDAQAALATYRG